MFLTHLGHACVLVETPAARLLIDPGTMSAFDRVSDLDAVFVTHQHPDHLDPARLADLLRANPSALLVVDPDTLPHLPVLPEGRTPRVVGPGDVVTLGGTSVRAVGGVHAPVYGDVPGCSNCGYLVDDGALLHPGDSFVVPEQDVDVLAVPVDGPWLKLSEAVDYVRAVHPRVAVPIHEGETTDPGKYAGMLAAFSPADVVRRLDPDTATSLGG